jgi:hypothetical protein
VAESQLIPFGKRQFASGSLFAGQMDRYIKCCGRKFAFTTRILIAPAPSSLHRFLSGRVLDKLTSRDEMCKAGNGK